MPEDQRSPDRPILVLTTNKEDMYVKLQNDLPDHHVFCHGTREQTCLPNHRTEKVEFDRGNIAFQSLNGQPLKGNVVVASYHDLQRVHTNVSHKEANSMFETVYYDEDHSFRSSAR